MKIKVNKIEKTPKASTMPVINNVCAGKEISPILP